MRKLMTYALVVIAVYVIGCGGEPVSMSELPGADPQTVLQTFAKATQEHNGEQMWNLISAGDKEYVAEMFREMLASEANAEDAAGSLNMTVEEVKQLSTKDLFLKMEEFDPLPALEIEEITETVIEGSTATITVDLERGRTEDITLVNENGVWKVSLFSKAAKPSAVAKEAKTVACMSNLKQLTLATFMYMQDYDDEFNPAALEDILPYIDEKPETLRCPEDTREVAFDKDAGNLAEYASYYIRKGYKQSQMTQPGAYIIAYDKVYYHTQRSQPAVNAAFSDGHIETIYQSQFEALMADQEQYGPATAFFGAQGETPPMPAMP